MQPRQYLNSPGPELNELGEHLYVAASSSPGRLQRLKQLFLVRAIQGYAGPVQGEKKVVPSEGARRRYVHLAHVSQCREYGATMRTLMQL